jgi:hypothetical protein
MARKIRIEDTGFHHILNRGVERRVIFDTAKDKEKFLDIVLRYQNIMTLLFMYMF